MRTLYRLHVEGDCDSYTCPACEHIDDSDICGTCDERHAGSCGLPDPDTLTHTDAACWSAMCRAVARAIRHELPYATAERIAEDLDQRAGSYADRADQGE